MSTTLFPNFKKLVTSQALTVLLGTQIVVYPKTHPGRQKEPPALSAVIQQRQKCHQQDVTQVLRKYASNVSIFLELLPRYKRNLYQLIRHFKAGCLSQYLSAWKKITSDEEAFQAVQGMKLEIE